MVARLTIGKKAYAAVEPRAREILAEAERLRMELQQLVDDDAAAYGKVSDAYRIPKDDARRSAAVDDALLSASQTPAEVVKRARRVHKLATEIGAIGNKNAASDARVAGLLAGTAIDGALENIKVNVAAMSDQTRGKDLLGSL
jgi:glutamate formiminotransferase/formiminotetrahydrofolate cyclodeaminase